MSTLNITLNPQAVDRLYEAFLCVSKFGEYVTLEARRNKLNFLTLNSTHSAHVRICVAGDSFCDAYNFIPDPQKVGSVSFNSQSQNSMRVEEGAFVCKVHVKALLPIFRNRLVAEPLNKERDESLVQGIEKCEISLLERKNKFHSRLVIKLFCRNSVLKTFKLQYEETDVLYATFLKEWGVHKWQIRANELKRWMEHFGPKAEHLDIGSEEDRASFTSFSEKIVDGAQILKHPLQTSIDLDIVEFNEFSVARDAHIAISVKDFKAIVMHAGTMEQVQISAAYGDPGQPMQITYDQHGIFCEFTLMTRKKGAAGPIATGKAEPVAKIVMHRPSAGPNAYAGGSGQGTRQTTPAVGRGSGMPARTPAHSAGPSRRGTETPAPMVPTKVSSSAAAPVPAPSFRAPASAEMPPPPLLTRATPREASVSAGTLGRDSIPPPSRQQSVQFRGTAAPRPSQSLFIMDEDEDDLFGPSSTAGAGDGGGTEENLLGDIDDEDILGWDADLDDISIQDLQTRAVSESIIAASGLASRSVSGAGASAVRRSDSGKGQGTQSSSYIDATQRQNPVKGIFDD